MWSDYEITFTLVCCKLSFSFLILDNFCAIFIEIIYDSYLSSWRGKQIFMLSAVSPEKMPLVLQNVRKVIKVGNCCICYCEFVTFFWNLARLLVHVWWKSYPFSILQPNGYVLLRDYATGDLAQVEFVVIFLCNPYARKFKKIGILEN